jgi:hypothetical protein
LLEQHFTNLRNLTNLFNPINLFPPSERLVF